MIKNAKINMNSMNIKTIYYNLKSSGFLNIVLNVKMLNNK